MNDDRPTSERKPGCAYRLLTLLVAALAVVGAGIAVRAITLPPELTGQVSLSLPLEVAAGVLWTALFALVCWRLLRRKPHAVDHALLLVLAFATYSFVRLLLFARADYDAGRLPFLLVTLELLLAAGIIRTAARWRHRHGFGRED
jgi:hypothetical protein